jgi:hypothetical protein
MRGIFPLFSFERGDYMRFKVLKSFVSSIGTFNEGDEKEVELDESTSKMWTEHGLIEEVKEAVTNDESK